MQIKNEELKKLSTSVFLERKDYNEIFQILVITKWTIIIELIGMGFMIAALMLVNKIVPCAICFTISFILFETEHLYRLGKVRDKIKKLFPNEDHPNVIRTLYDFQPNGLHVSIEKPAGTEKFTISYNGFIRKQESKNYAIYTTKDRKHYIVFPKKDAPDAYFGFKD